MGKAVLDSVEVLLLRFESDVSKIFRPIAERAVSVELRATHLRNTLGVPCEPVLPHELGVQVAFRDESLNSA
jgi:hypothetical protein